MKTLIAAIALLFGSTVTLHAQDAAAVDSTLRRYASMVTAMDPAGVVAMFTPDGEIVNPGQVSIKGREAITRTLLAFAAFQIIENETIPTSPTATGNYALQTGTYHQRVRTPSGETVEVSGTFRADWRREPKGRWLIQRMQTTPLVTRAH